MRSDGKAYFTHKRSCSVVQRNPEASKGGEVINKCEGPKIGLFGMTATISENGRRVLQARYLRRDGRGHVIEAPEQLFERVARAISEAELLHGTAAE